MVREGEDVNDVKPDVEKHVRNLSEQNIEPITLDAVESEQTAMNENSLEFLKREARGKTPRGQKAIPDDMNEWAALQWKQRVQLINQSTDTARLYFVKRFESSPAVVDALNKRLIHLKA